jgi:hypothetical protein
LRQKSGEKNHLQMFVFAEKGNTPSWLPLKDKFGQRKRLWKLV